MTLRLQKLPCPLPSSLVSAKRLLRLTEGSPSAVPFPPPDPDPSAEPSSMRKLFLPLPALFCTQECRNSKIPNLMRLGIFMFMVEARGFEPLSEGNATQVSTGIVTVLLSPSGPPVTGSPSGQPGCPLPSAAGGGYTTKNGHKKHGKSAIQTKLLYLK